MSLDPAGSARGLSATEAARRLQADGAKALTAPRRRTPLRLLREVAGEPMFQRLLAAGGLYLLLGDVGEALVLLAFVLFTALISLWQGLRTERALAALRDLTSPRALVIRDGRPQRIAGVEVVRGDLLVLSEGDRVAADARLLSANDLRVDESLLTGEAAAVAKHATPGPGGDAAASGPLRPGPEASDRVYAGTLVTRGQGLAEALAPLLEFGLLACEHKPFDPMDQACRSLAQERLTADRHHPDWTLAHDYGLRACRR